MANSVDRSSSEAGIRLKDACPDFVSAIRQHLERVGRDGVSRELDDVVVPAQALGGVDDDFSFMAYAVPRLTQNERKRMNLVESEEISIPLADSIIRIDLDDFGKINWFYVKNWPAIYGQLKQRLSEYTP